MKKNYFLIGLFLLPILVFGQRRPQGAYNPSGNMQSQFLSKQWWIGLRGGINLSSVNVGQRYTAIAPLNYTSSLNDKEYKDYKNPGTEATLDIGFYYHNFSVCLQPTYRHMRFSYTNGFEWTDSENPDNHLVLQYDQDQKLDYFDLPLLFKYDLTLQKARPYLQAGVFEAFRISAFKSVTVSGTDYASGGESHFSDDPIIVGASDLFTKHYWGLVGGVGLGYHLGNIRLNLDVIYRKGVSSITSANHRYGNDRLSGIGEALDDLKTDNISISLGCYLPTRFLTRNFQSVNH